MVYNIGMHRNFGALADLGDAVPTCLAELALGLVVNKPDRPLRVHDPRVAGEFVQELTRKMFPSGSTRISARGTYFSDDRREIIREPVVVVRLYNGLFTEKDARRGCAEFVRGVRCLAKTLAGLFQQESVLVSIAYTTGRRTLEFVGAGERVASCASPVSRLPGRLHPVLLRQRAAA